MINIPPTASLQPEEYTSSTGSRISVIRSKSTELVRFDIINEAGSAYQDQKLCAAAASRLHTVASLQHTAAEVAEWLDYRGIVMENNPDVLCCTTTIYSLRKYCDSLLPFISELRRQPAFPEDDFKAYCARRKQEIQTMSLQSKHVARRLFYEALFGREHPLGCYAVAEDADRLSLDSVKSFYRKHYFTAPTLIVSGNVDDDLVKLFDREMGTGYESVPPAHTTISSLQTSRTEPCAGMEQELPGSVQTTIRVGRILPIRWDSLEYARLMILVTALGGYFGSRLMSNLREEKGYTYGIYARTQIYRGCIVFYITTDVAKGVADKAVHEIVSELDRCCKQPMGEEELELVKTVLSGDFVRSIDGVFERAERLGSMLQSHIDERFTDNLRLALQTTSAMDLQQLAEKYLSPDQMTICRAGILE